MKVVPAWRLTSLTEPLLAAILSLVVLDGELAVPCTRNPL